MIMTTMLRTGIFSRAAVHPVLPIQRQKCCRSIGSAALSNYDNSTAPSTAPTVKWNEAKPFEHIPGPKPLPVVGNMFLFTKGIGELGGVPFTQMGPVLHKKYGPVVRITKIPGKPPLVFLKDVDGIQQVFRSEGQWPLREGQETLGWYIRNRRKNATASLISSQGKEWKEFRTAVNQAVMQPRTMKYYVTPVHEVARDFIDRMAYLRDSKNEMPDNFSREITKYAFEVMTYVALETRLGVLKKDASPDSEALMILNNTRNVVDAMEKMELSAPIWKIYSTKTFREFVRSMDNITRISEKYVTNAAKRLLDARKNPSSLAESEKNDFSVLGRILGDSGDIGKAVNMAMDMIFGGSDTTGMAASAVMYFLASNPDKQRKLQEELDRVLPDPKKVPTHEDMAQLSYLRACIKEAMRLEPVVNFNSRTAQDDTVLLGYRIPKGAQILLSNTVMYQEEAMFPRAKEFIPERWLRGSENLRPKHPFVFLPFGFGPRMCVGKRFADLAMETLLSQVFRNYNLEWHYPPPKVATKLVSHYASPLKIRVIDRK